MENELTINDRTNGFTDIEADLYISKAEIEQLKKENETLRNELCLRCGGYRTAHKGSCNSCRWKKNKID